MKITVRFDVVGYREALTSWIDEAGRVEKVGVKPLISDPRRNP